MSEDLNRLKQFAAEAAARLAENGMVIGLGTGSTSALVIVALAKRVKDGLRITGIPTSEATAAQARALGIPLSSFDEYPRIDLAIDGADEVEEATLDVVKGRGGALLREKIVASVSSRFVIVVDQSKLVAQLGSRGPVPVEVISFGWQTTATKIRELNGDPALRLTSAGEPFKTDGGNYILDCDFHSFSPKNLSADLDNVVGIVEHGLFLGMATEIYIGEPAGVRVITR